MKNQITLNVDQLHEFMEITNGILDCQGTHDIPQVYEDFLFSTFGENWSELMGEWDDLYCYEFEIDVYLNIVSGIKTTGLEEWINQGKEILERILIE
jgi:hypothetical protein